MSRIPPPQLPTHFTKVAVIGFGLTGQSVMRFFGDSTVELIAMDTRDYPPNKQELQAMFPDARWVTGGLDQHTLHTADIVVVSPGVDTRALQLEKRVGKQTKVVGDIGLFTQYAKAPLIAITGSNGKSTVATLVDLIINASAKSALLGGNIGVPALDLLAQPKPDFYVLELSSFQLDSVQALNAQVAALLNVSADHMDRYASFADYAVSKSSIYRGAQREVVNRDDPTAPGIYGPNTISFGLGPAPAATHFGLLEAAGSHWIVKGDEKILDTAKLTIKGTQNWANVMAALAIVDQAGVTWSEQALQEVCQFPGLAHRCEWVANLNGVDWINDSKGTNVGATIAAIKGISESKVLIMGGQGKGADFSALRPVMDESVHKIILLGEDAGQIEAAVGDLVNCQHAEDLEAAIAMAAKAAQKGDVVLFSPACASFDQFASYVARGEAFKVAVKALQAEAQQ